MFPPLHRVRRAGTSRHSHGTFRHRNLVRQELFSSHLRGLRPFLYAQRLKIRIQRDKVLDSCIKLVETYGKDRGVLEIEYFDEVCAVHPSPLV